jgi:hypothetical protein
VADETPAHYLPISDTVGKQVDKWREGKAPAPPMEAFMSDESMAQVERQTKLADTPVHAEDLIPISPQDAARRQLFDGDTLPSHPTARRVIPPPFRRPRVNGGAHGKTWHYVRADHVLEGDMTEAVGRVTSISSGMVYGNIEGHTVAVQEVIILIGLGGARADFDPGSQVRVHRVPELWTQLTTAE